VYLCVCVCVCVWYAQFARSDVCMCKCKYCAQFEGSDACLCVCVYVRMFLCVYVGGGGGAYSLMGRTDAVASAATQT